jgi:hypothetical protein
MNASFPADQIRETELIKQWPRFALNWHRQCTRGIGCSA